MAAICSPCGVDLCSLCSKKSCECDHSNQHADLGPTQASNGAG